MENQELEAVWNVKVIKLARYYIQQVSKLPSNST
jgi:hypothetical protein